MAQLSVALAIVVLFLLAAGGLAVYLLRRPENAPPPQALTDAVEDPEARADRQRLLDERGEELLERRAALDATRGTLGGQTEIVTAFEDLENRLRSGAISEEEFEQEKIRLLGG